MGRSNAVVAAKAGKAAGVVTAEQDVGDRDVRAEGGDLRAQARARRRAWLTSSGVFSSGGVGFTVGKQQQSLNQEGTSTTAAASTVGSIAGQHHYGSGWAIQANGFRCRCA